MTLQEYAAVILAATAATKEQLEWMKFGLFSNKKTPKGSLRHDANMTGITGIEVDLDRETLGFDEVVDIIEKAGLEALIYTSPSHLLNGHGPRLRVLCPTSKQLKPAARDHLICRAAGLFRDGPETLISGESYTRSQSYYFGRVGNNPEHRVKVIEGQCIDELDELDEIALGKPATKTGGGGGKAEPWLAGADEEKLCKLILTGTSYHNAGMRLLGVWASRGVPMLEAKQRLEKLFDGVDESQHDDPWRHRRASIPALLAHVWGKEAIKRDEAEAELEEFETRVGPPPGAPVDEEERLPWAEPPQEEQWPEMAAEAFHGLAGEVVDAIAPTTEADPVAILTHFLLEAGNAIGRKPYYLHEATRHYPNLFALLLGRTSKARKGTSADRVKEVMVLAAPERANSRVKGGLSSGEGVIAQIHDEIRTQEKVRRKDKTIEYIDVVKTKAVEDKRLMLLETEFAGALGSIRRDGNILSRVLRDAYDGRLLETLIKNNPIKATDPHISVIAHCTIAEYQRLIDETSLSNGFCNRFVHLLVRRAQLLRFGAGLDQTVRQRLAERTHAAIEMARMWNRVDFTGEAKELWIANYAELSAEKPGLFGDIIARAEAHTVRLAMLYALLDRRREIYPEHLRAALAFWSYAEASALYVFGDATGNPVADEIMRALRQYGPDGRTRTQLSELFSRHRGADQIGAALAFLVSHGKARTITRPTGGRPVEVWLAC
jgi:hypothetical protein